MSEQLAAFTGGAPAPAVQPSALRPVAQNVYMTDFNDTSVTQYEFPLYSGKTGIIDRIAVLEPGNIVRGRSHFHDKLKGGILCNSVYTLSADRKTETLAQEANCCKWLGKSQIRYAALVLHYNTDPRGNIVMPFGFQLKLWRFGVDKYIMLRTVNGDFPLSRFDLQVSCQDEKYQKMQIGAKPECLLLHPNFPPEEKARITAWATTSVNKLKDELGRKFENDADLMKHLTESGVILNPAQQPTMVPSGAALPSNPFGGAGAAPTAADKPIANFEDIISQATATQEGPAQPLPGTAPAAAASAAPNPFTGA